MAFPSNILRLARWRQWNKLEHGPGTMHRRDVVPTSVLGGAAAECQTSVSAPREFDPE